MQDSELLRDYVKNGSEAAFARLVERYVNLVYGTAHRMVSDQYQAEEIAQNVFCLLAQKAGSFTSELTLAGWLHRTTRFISARAFRKELRRRQREQCVAAINATHATGDATWDQISPQLDAALEQLSGKDRLVILLRFFQQKSMREVGAAMGVSEAAAKARLDRAVDQVRRLLAKRGVTCSATLLTAVLSQHCTETAPVALAADITVGALASVTGRATLPFFTYLTLLCRLKTKTVFACSAGLIALTIVIAQFYYTAPTEPADTVRSAPPEKPSLPAREAS